MALPKLLSPEFSVELPSTKQPVKFRPFLVKEEKVLFMAMESGEPRDIQKSVMNVLRSCILTPDVEVDKLTAYDVEYLFLQLRSKSVGEQVEVNLTHQDPKIKELCTHEQKVSINLEDIKVTFNENHTDVVNISEDIGVKMRAPSLDVVLSNSGNKEVSIDNSMNILAKCIVHVFDKDRNGYLDPIEMKRVFTKIGEVITDNEVEDQLRAHDIDGDCHLVMAEFMKMILQFQKGAR